MQPQALASRAAPKPLDTFDRCCQGKRTETKRLWPTFADIVAAARHCSRNRDLCVGPIEDENRERKRQFAAVEDTLGETAVLDPAALHERDLRQRLLIENLVQAVWETDAAGVVIADSPSWRAHTGQSLSEWLGYGWLDAIHPDDQAYAERQWREAMATRSLVNAEFRLRAPDGGWRWTNVRAAPVLDGAGQIEKWAGINIDIDTRKRAEAALRESEERRDLALEATQLGTFVWHVREDRGEPDERMLALFDQPPDGGLNLRDALATMIHPDDGAGYAAAVAKPPIRRVYGNFKRTSV